MRITPLCRFGLMVVYERARGPEPWVPKYIVINEATGRVMEEFRRKASAVKWARENAKG